MDTVRGTGAGAASVGAHLLLDNRDTPKAGGGKGPLRGLLHTPMLRLPMPEPRQRAARWCSTCRLERRDRSPLAR